MMNKKKLADIKAEVAALWIDCLGNLRAWLAKEIESARRDPNRDVETLEMLCAALECEVSKRRKPNTTAPSGETLNGEAASASHPPAQPVDPLRHPAAP